MPSVQRAARLGRWISPSEVKWTAVGVSSLLFIVYAVTGAPGAWWGDGLELTAAAATLGVPHPTGYPLYLLAGHLLIRAFSFLDPGRVMTLFSSLCCAAAGGLLALFFQERMDETLEAYRGRGPEPREPGASLAGLIGGAGLALMLGFTSTLWDHATFAEVYPLTFLLVAASLFCAGRGTPGVVGLACITGLAMLNHYSFAAMGPLILFTLWSRAGAPRRAALGTLLFAAIALPFLLLYAYIPLRAAVNPPINIGDAQGWRGLIWVLSGGDYGHTDALAHPAWKDRALSGLSRWLFWWGEQALPARLTRESGPVGTSLGLQLGWMLAAGGLAGCLILARRRPALGYGLSISMLATLAFGVLHPIPDIDPYFLPALAPCAAGWMELVITLTASARRAWPALPHGRRVAAAPLILAIAAFASHFPEIDKSWDEGPRVWAGNLLEGLPQDALVLTRQAADGEIYSLWYEQIVKHRRPDVTVFGTGFIFSGWYARYFESAGRPRIPLFVTQRPPGDKNIFDVALLGGVIMPNVPHRRVFSTYLDPTLERYMAPVAVKELLPDDYYARTAYKLNPPGRMLYELHPDAAFGPLAASRFREIFDRDPPR